MTTTCRRSLFGDICHASAARVFTFGRELPDTPLVFQDIARQTRSALKPLFRPFVVRGAQGACLGSGNGACVCKRGLLRMSYACRRYWFEWRHRIPTTPPRSPAKCLHTREAMLSATRAMEPSPAPRVETPLQRRPCPPPNQIESFCRAVLRLRAQNAASNVQRAAASVARRRRGARGR